MRIPESAINCIVVLAFCAPMIGIAAAAWTHEPLWLFLCFALALFL